MSTARQVKPGDFVQVLWLEGIGVDLTKVWRTAKACDCPAADGSILVELLEIGRGRSQYAVGDVVRAHRGYWR